MSMANQVKLSVGQIITMILGVALFIYGLIGWVHPDAGVTLPFLCPIGILLLGLLLLLGGGYFIPAFQASGAGELAVAAVAVIAIIGVVVAGMFVPGIVEPCDGTWAFPTTPTNTTTTTTTNTTTTTTQTIKYYLQASPSMDALWAGIAEVRVFQTSSLLNLIEIITVDDGGTQQGTTAYDAATLVWLKIETDSGLYIESFSLIAGETVDTWMEFNLLSEVDDVIRGTINLRWVIA